MLRRNKGGALLLYIYLKQSALLDKGSPVALRDVAQLCAVGAQVKSIRDIELARLAEDPLLITAADVIAAVNREDVTMLGASACAVLPRNQPQNKWIAALKTLFVAMLLFIGGGMTVLAYQTDVSMPDVHTALAELFTGDAGNVLWVTLPYCLGVGLGVLFFSNVLPGRKKEPTIFELEQFQKENETIQYQNAKAEEEK